MQSNCPNELEVEKSEVFVMIQNLKHFKFYLRNYLLGSHMHFFHLVLS